MQDSKLAGSSLHRHDNAVRIAYIVLAHSDTAHFKRLMHRLNDPRCTAFVHVDAKSPLEPFRQAVRNLDRIHFIEPRTRVMWAGFSQVQSTITSLEFAIAGTGPDCTHFVIISGADYPLTNNDEILRFFDENRNRQFIRRFAVMKSGDNRQLWRLKGRHFREWADRFTPQRKPLFLLEQFLHLFPRRIPKDITFALGSNWVALTRECAVYCVNRARHDHALVDFFRPVFGPDELFLHTLVENSPFVLEADPIEEYVDITRVGGPFHYGNVHALTPEVPIRTANEADRLLATRGKKLFSRKFSSIHSAAALDRLDAVAAISPKKMNSCGH